MTGSMTKWLALRLAVPGLSQREVERRLGWKRGHLSLIERGVEPNKEQDAQLRRFYAATLVADDKAEASA